MKKLIFILILTVCFTQSYEDVVILKNGGEVHGIIIEQKPNEYIKIQSGKNIFVYQMDEIELIKKELVEDDINDDVSGKMHNIKSNTRSLGIGFGNQKVGFALLGFSNDFKLTENLSVFLSAGIPSVGFGFSHQSNYNNNGTHISATLGQFYVEETEEFITSIGAVASYQWRLGKQGFISAGLMLGILPNAISSCDYDGDCTYTINDYEYIFPMVSYDYRF